MKSTIKTFRMALLAAACLGLTACESMDGSMAGIKSGFGNIVTAGSDAIGSLTSGKNKKTEQTAPAPEAILAADEGCPDITVVNDLSSLHRFIDMDNPVENSKISSIAITDVANGCRHMKNNIVVEMNIRFEGETGNRARIRDTDKPSFSYPYFVAVTSPHGTILSKEIYALNVSYEDNTDDTIVTEQIRQIIPVDDGAYGPDHTILVGFQLNDKELAYNRKMIRDNADKAFAMSTTAPPSQDSDVAAIEPAAGGNGQQEAMDEAGAPINITVPDMEP